jgi:hypothetical protein
VFYRRFYEANGMLGVLLDRRMPRRNRDAPNRTEDYNSARGWLIPGGGGG